MAAPTWVSGGKHFKQGDAFPPTTPGKLRIYSMRFCPFAQRARMVASHKNVFHEIVNVDLQQKPDWFLERNPSGTVPVLEIDGKVLHDSIIGSDFIDETYTENPLHPKDPFKKAKQRLLVDKCVGMLMKYYPLMFNDDKEKADSLKTEVGKGFDFLNSSLNDKYIGGQSPCMSDYLIWTVVEKILVVRQMLGLEEAVNLEKYSNVKKWVDSMKSTAAYKATCLPESDILTFLEGYAKHAPVYDFNQ